MPNKYCNLTPSKKISNDFQNITTGFDRVQKDTDAAKQELVSQDQRINNIIGQTGESNTEIVDARQPETGNAYPVLKDRLDATDKLIMYGQKQSMYYAECTKKVVARNAIKVVCQGDSLTYGQDETSPDKRPPGSDPTLDPDGIYTAHTQAGKTYPEALQEFCNSMFGSGMVTIVNRGYSGDWADASRTRWTRNPNADLHLVMLGTNDASTNSFVPPDVRQNISKYVEDMSKLVEQIIDFGSAVVLLSPPKKENDSDAMLESFRKALQIVGDRYLIPVFDSQTFLSAYPFSTIQSDNVHYNTKGYTTFGAKVAGLLSGLGSVYKPLVLSPKQVVLPVLDEYGVVTKGNITQAEHSVAPLGVGSVDNNGLMFIVSSGSKLTFPFYTEFDNLVITPIFNVVTGEDSLNFKIDFGVDPGSYVSPYAFGVSSRSAITAASPLKELNYTGPNDRTAIQFEQASSVMNNSFHLPKKGMYSVSVENTGSSSQAYLFGFFVRKYEDIFENMPGIRVFTTHASLSDSNPVTTSVVDPYELISERTIEGFAFTRIEYWRIPPLKLVVHNHDYSTIEYIIHFGIANGDTSWKFGKVSQIDYEVDRSQDRTLDGINFDGTNLTLTWGGAVNRPTMYTLSLFS